MAGESFSVNEAGIVVIGRNEGERLRRCLRSVTGRQVPVIYVDSGSTDGSAELAQEMGCESLRLDPGKPFSAARARNEGMTWISLHRPDLRYVQFLDGDSELLDGWLDQGVQFLESRPDACSVFGRLQERDPGKSIYNRLCEVDWRMPLGEVHCFGGITLMRVKAFLETGGFEAALIAGEEPEFSQRLRKSGWKILSVESGMALHDAGITRFGQWWTRALRSGHAYAEVCSRGTGLRRFGLRQSLRTWFWAFLLPALAVGSFFLHRAAPLAFAGLFLVQQARIAAGVLRAGSRPWTAILYGLFWGPAQAAQWLGQLKFLALKMTRRQARLIEYKGPDVPAARGERELP
jgi:GT2 family glycosyltransferase